MNDIEYRGCKIRFEQDNDGPNPRTDYDHLGEIVHWHPRYDFGKQMSGEDVRAMFKGLDCVRLPLALLDHSGLHLYVGVDPHWSDTQGWDSGHVGFIYATLDKARENWGVPDADWDTLVSWGKEKITLREATTRCLDSEVEEYDAYLRGDVWGWIVEDWEGEEIGWSAGYIGWDQCEDAMTSEAKASIDHHINHCGETAAQPGEH